jgi:hypothetical protein
VAGAAAVSRFGWLFYPLGAVLVWTAVRLAGSQPDGQPQEPRTRLMSWLRRHALAAHRLLTPPGGQRPRVEYVHWCS